MSKRAIGFAEFGIGVCLLIFVPQWSQTQNGWIAVSVVLCGCSIVFLELGRYWQSNVITTNHPESDELLSVSGCQDDQRAGDVVFVHGLNGNARDYWCHEGNPEHFWPTWLGEELTRVGVWSLGYENAALAARHLTFLNGTGLRGSAMPLTDRAKNVLLRLELKGIGNRPLVFVTHSMGGLLVKQMLRTANESTTSKWQAIVKSTRGVCFIATPHSGSDLARWVSCLRTILGSNVSVDELRPHEPLLRNLKEWYSNFVAREEISIETISFHETKALSGVGIVVEAGDADPGVPNSLQCPLDEDHVSICKPRTRESILYRYVMMFVHNAINKNTNGATQYQHEDLVEQIPPNFRQARRTGLR
jgi:pimeloyl-ACP methyl ester carboxylesterase